MRLLYSKPELRDLSQGSRISFARQFRFMSQHELADKLGITGDNKRRTMTRYEKCERNANPLKNLSYTYFTVENINHEIPNKRRGMTKDEKEYYAQLELADKENLRPIELVIKKIFKSDYDLRYNIEANHRVHLSVRINRELKQREKTMLYLRS